MLVTGTQFTRQRHQQSIALGCRGGILCKTSLWRTCLLSCHAGGRASIGLPLRQGRRSSKSVGVLLVRRTAGSTCARPPLVQSGASTMVSCGFPWSPTVSCGPPGCPVVSCGLPWIPVSPATGAHRNPPWDPVGSRGISWDFVGWCVGWLFWWKSAAKSQLFFVGFRGPAFRGIPWDSVGSRGIPWDSVGFHWSP